jgi:hypothetical protein
MENESHTGHDGVIHFGFLSYVQFDKGTAFRGGILITDANCKPVEFRCTSPVKPNPLQRTLYGQTMLPHIAVDLMGIPLLKSVQLKPSVVIIREELFFDVRSKSDVPFIHLYRQNGEIKTGGEGVADRQKRVALDSVSGKFQPVVISAHWQHQEDLESWREKLRELFGTTDLVEPFERLTKALEFVHQEGILET